MKDYAVMRSDGLTHDQAAAVIRSSYRDNGCEYEARRDIYMKISDSMKKENASQEALLKHLIDTWA